MLIAFIVVAAVLVTGAVIGGLAGREPHPIDPPQPVDPPRRQRRQRSARHERREPTTQS